MHVVLRRVFKLQQVVCSCVLLSATSTRETYARARGFPVVNAGVDASAKLSSSSRTSTMRYSLSTRFALFVVIAKT